MLDMFGVAAAAGLENAQRLEDAQRLATVEERERIARDLHDDLGQLLGYLTTKIQAARELVATDRPSAAAEELAGLGGRDALVERSGPGGDPRTSDLGRTGPHAGAGGRGVHRGVRDTVGAPHVLLRSGHRRRFPRDLGAVSGDADRPGGDVQRPQHADATTVAVALDEHDGVLELSVRDDGAGFDPVAAAHSGRFGLTTMAERARAVGGTLDIRSAPGEGTTIALSVPARSAVT